LHTGTEERNPEWLRAEPARIHAHPQPFVASSDGFENLFDRLGQIHDIVGLRHHAAEAVGAPDILVNVAGTNIRKRFEEYTEEEYRTMLDTNLNGIVRLTRAVGARMIARGEGGKIVNIGALASFVGLPYLSVYAMTKGAIAQMTRALAAEWGRYNIQVNCVAPGWVETEMSAAALRVFSASRKASSACSSAFRSPNIVMWTSELSASSGPVGQPE